MNIIYWNVNVFCLLGIAYTVVTVNPETIKTDGIVLTAEEKSYVFISDDIFQGIIPTVNECWNTLLVSLLFINNNFFRR